MKVAAGTETAPAVELSELTRGYGDRPVLRGVSVTVPAGATLAVFGPNGAGKSTLLSVLATLLRPQGGTTRVLGNELPKQGWAVRGRLGLLAHEPLLYRDLTARENLRHQARLHGVRLERVEELLDQVGLSRRAAEPLRTLSRGMVQRADACRAVLHSPDLLLLDEPRAHLDLKAAELVEPLIGRASGATRVITSHDPAAGLAEADQVLGLRDGRVAVAGPASAVSQEDLKALYR